MLFCTPLVGTLTNFDVLTGEDVLFLLEVKAECFRYRVVVEAAAIQEQPSHI